MAQNDFKSFAVGAGANVTSQAEWEALAALVTGFQSGKASSAQINKAIRQASFIAAALAQYTSDKTGGDVLDDGDQAAFITKMTAAFGKDFQPLDATLTALAALTGAADKLPYFNGTDTVALTALTAFAREILAQTDAAGVLSKLGLGNLPNFGDAASKNVGITAGTVAAGDDSRFGLMIGVGQAWQVFTNRVADTTYTNSTGKPIFVSVTVFWNGGNNAATASLNVNGTLIQNAICRFTENSKAVFVTAIIPAGATYSVSGVQGTISTWAELR